MVSHRRQPGRTVVEQIANLWHDYGVSGKTMGEAVRNAFSVQPVTDAFFRDYKAAYDDAVSLIAANIERVDAEQFTQTLFNRLLFVHFVSRKDGLSSTATPTTSTLCGRTTKHRPAAQTSTVNG